MKQRISEDRTDLSPHWWGAVGGLVLLPAGQAMGEQTGTVVGWGRDTLPFVRPGTRFTAIACGDGFCLGLKTDGTVLSWGATDEVPTGLTNVIAIPAGWDHSLALRTDGTVIAWGSNTNGQCDVPAGLSNVTVIAAGAFHNLALRADGTVVAWGLNSDGQCDVPAGLTHVFAISAGNDHSLALVAATPVAQLQARILGENVLLTWPGEVAGLQLQTTTNLAAPNSWATLPDVPTVVDSQNVITNPLSGGNRFYRLRQEAD